MYIYTVTKSVDNNKVEFQDLPAGSLFLFRGASFLKLKSSTEDRAIAIKLQDGSTWQLYKELQVQPISKLTMKGHKSE